MNGKKWSRVALALALLLALANLGLGAATAQTDFESGEILVQFQPGTSGQAIAEAHRQNGGQVEETIPGIGVQVVRVAPGQERARVAAYQRNPNVKFAEVNGYYYATAIPNDTRVGEQWQYGKIAAFEAWDTPVAVSPIKIAILDTGIDQSHVDLASKVVLNLNFSSSRSTDDKYGHGTHVAGSAAAITNNGIGVAGTCPDCKLLNIKVLGDSGSGSWSGIAKGIDAAVANGANVVNLSLGGGASSTVEAAVNSAWSRGVIVVASAGNDGVETPSYPAYYANAIAVGATDSGDNKASWSNYGTWVDVAAPGVAILSTAPDHKSRIWSRVQNYATLSGTSMAAPHVAGLAGFILSTGACAVGDNACVRDRIENRSDAIPGTGTSFAHGRINAFNSVQP